MFIGLGWDTLEIELRRGYDHLFSRFFNISSANNLSWFIFQNIRLPNDHVYVAFKP